MVETGWNSGIDSCQTQVAAEAVRLSDMTVLVVLMHSLSARWHSARFTVLSRPENKGRD